MKLFLSVLSFLSCALWGYFSSLRLFRQEKSLLLWHDTLKHLENQVSYFHHSIPQMLLEIGKENEIIKIAGEKLMKNPALSPELLFSCEAMELPAPQRQIIQRGLAGLWSENRELQLLCLREARQKIAEETEVFQAFCKKYARLYQTLGLLGGGALFIFLC